VTAIFSTFLSSKNHVIPRYLSFVLIYGMGGTQVRTGGEKVILQLKVTLGDWLNVDLITKYESCPEGKAKILKDTTGKLSRGDGA